jgi:hypothetical protein
MSEKNKVNVEVYNWDDDFAVLATDFISEIQSLLDGVPEEFRSVAIIEFDRRGDDYDYSEGTLTMHYERLETDDEHRARDQYAARSQNEYEARERREYERLKAKFKE